MGDITSNWINFNNDNAQFKLIKGLPANPDVIDQIDQHNEYKFNYSKDSETLDVYGYDGDSGDGFAAFAQRFHLKDGKLLSISSPNLVLEKTTDAIKGEKVKSFLVDEANKFLNGKGDDKHPLAVIGKNTEVKKDYKVIDNVKKLIDIVKNSKNDKLKKAALEMIRQHVRQLKINTENLKEIIKTYKNANVSEIDSALERQQLRLAKSFERDDYRSNPDVNEIVSLDKLIRRFIGPKGNIPKKLNEIKDKDELLEVLAKHLYNPPHNTLDNLKNDLENKGFRYDSSTDTIEPGGKKVKDLLKALREARNEAKLEVMKKGYNSLLYFEDGDNISDEDVRKATYKTFKTLASEGFDPDYKKFFNPNDLNDKFTDDEFDGVDKVTKGNIEEEYISGTTRLKSLGNGNSSKVIKNVSDIESKSGENFGDASNRKKKVTISNKDKNKIADEINDQLDPGGKINLESRELKELGKKYGFDLKATADRLQKQYGTNFNQADEADFHAKMLRYFLALLNGEGAQDAKKDLYKKLTDHIDLKDMGFNEYGSSGLQTFASGIIDDIYEDPFNAAHHRRQFLDFFVNKKYSSAEERKIQLSWANDFVNRRRLYEIVSEYGTLENLDQLVDKVSKEVLNYQVKNKGAISGSHPISKYLSSGNNYVKIASFSNDINLNSYTDSFAVNTSEDGEAEIEYGKDLKELLKLLIDPEEGETVVYDDQVEDFLKENFIKNKKTKENNADEDYRNDDENKFEVKQKDLNAWIQKKIKGVASNYERQLFKPESSEKTEAGRRYDALLKYNDDQDIQFLEVAEVRRPMEPHKMKAMFYTFVKNLQEYKDHRDKGILPKNNIKTRDQMVQNSLYDYIDKHNVFGRSIFYGGNRNLI